MQSNTASIKPSGATKGIILGIIAAISYGTNPLFAVPLYAFGLSVSSVLFYRYGIATIILGLIMLAKMESFRLTLAQLCMMTGMGVLFALSSVFLFESYNYMDVGLASTLLFMQPVIIVLILWAFYHQRINGSTLLSVAICILGVICLCNPGDDAHVSARGIALVLLSALSYAIYMVAINKTSIGRLSSLCITFYSLLFGQLVFAATTHFFTRLQGVPFSPLALACIIGISVIPTIISLATVAVSIKYVGSVTVSILGAFEPVTGLIVGSLLFDEILTGRAIVGIILILSSVIVIIKSAEKEKAVPQ